jgi:acetyl-CoA carboxylase biotin carboxyl carrier protein
MSENILSPLPGKVLKFLVKVGDQVKEDDEIIILEAVKMENIIYATAGGIVQEFKVKEGDLVETDQVMIVLG